MSLKQRKRTSARRSGRRASQAVRRNLRPQRQTAEALPAVNHPEPVVSVIIPAMNEARTIAAVIAGARGVHPRCEVIVIVNGSADNTAEIAHRMGAKVITFPQPLGHDVGRSVGAEAARGEILLFTDGDLVISAAELRPFVEAVSSGADVALNDYSGPVSSRIPHPVILSKYTLNVMLGRPDLNGYSLTAVPHALSRKALTALGSAILSRPPLAHARAVLEGLQMKAVHKVPVGRMNAVRRKEGGRDPLQEVILSDHLEAMGLLLERRGERAGYSDAGRRREMVR
ncbi:MULTISPECIES: glycosyltransferase [unclassified Paenibacillus]|uniref:glycosyltransferase family 2 protein n=1 Tax=unclassified Paenibacillus TaxID=185978 RepID=UPI0024074A22|nr:MULTISPECIES: glycosyltransferase [unclassified Paenibacillus]MDF9845234.1 glycosyltransferase involved in cell wall biosynthesis [Paenibacillus sp. PastF-2]MDF9851816.1 glycosyltransferase involved in cell wall biosynthesis [Paenibacillus sp. PastM-2]MDF9858419.1 glycosyltransferase involved in cell wall biosynthesis [Paenibacillus sp. PastF-1]MDH6483571.1 glycosyltransferase involved in cell wall biosynthesis [Paenibacillus sp. PastH-2]MDH6511049.1 glycosyltransferase involved in cell wal